MENMTGVFPCYVNQFKVGATKETATIIKDMETFGVAFDNEIQEWKSYGEEGWTRRLMTAKSITISVNGKRNIGDPGNDFIAGLAFKNGKGVSGVIIWIFPDTTEIEVPCVFNVTNINVGDSSGVGPLEFEAQSDGKPKITEPAVAPEVQSASLKSKEAGK